MGMRESGGKKKVFIYFVAYWAPSFSHTHMQLWRIKERQGNQHCALYPSYIHVLTVCLVLSSLFNSAKIFFFFAHNMCRVEVLDCECIGSKIFAFVVRKRGQRTLDIVKKNECFVVGDARLFIDIS